MDAVLKGTLPTMLMRIAPLAVSFAVATTPILAAPLAAHRAVYEITLGDASDRSGVKGVRGRLVYDFDGTECDGYTVNFRFVTRIQLERDVRVTDQQMTTFEDVGETMFRFVTRSFTDEQPDREVNGTASGADDGVEVELEGRDEPVELSSAVFPTQHLLDLIEAARNGDTVHEARVFDGSEDGDRALDTTAVFGSPERGGEGKDALPAEFADLTYWPVSIAYYTTGDQSGEALPVYRIEMKLYENGVTRDIAMDYGEFRLEGELSEIELREVGDCD